MRISPSRDEFRSLAVAYGVVPVWAEVLADRHTPVGAFLALVGDGPGFLLESVEHGERWARFSFVGCRPRAEIAMIDGTLH
ncbi:MAG: anthranilate synthase component I, partial [Ilumatobacteraceae bacterium]